MGKNILLNVTGSISCYKACALTSLLTKKGYSVKVIQTEDSMKFVGKASFEDEKLIENLKAFINVILKARPSTIKGIYVKNITISSTMGPGIKLDINSFDK